MMEKVIDLNNEYYELIPWTDFAYDKMNLLGETYSVNQELNHINQIFDLDYPIKLVYAAYYNAKKLNPYDYIIDALPCSIKPLNP